MKPRFFKPVLARKRTYAGLVFDYKGDGLDVKERGLDGECESTGKGHDWLFIPHEEGQKEYLICLKCYQSSHL